jgi:chemotaxis protein methyltransferase CheR
MTDTEMTAADALFNVVQAMIDSFRQCLLILDDNLRVVATNRAFCAAFSMDAGVILNKSVGEIGNGEWGFPELRTSLLKVISQDKDMQEYEIKSDFPAIGRRTLLLNASRLVYAGAHSKSILLQIEDVTDRRFLDNEKDELLKQKDFLIEEMNHRVSNSLQIIASILMLKARTVTSKETRLHLEDAHRRVMAVATAQGHLRPHVANGEIGARSYLTGLCDSLSNSLVADDRPISINVLADEGTFTTDQAVSLGLITTELIINAIKHAFPNNRSGEIVVRYESGTTAWRLSVADDGIGISKGLSEPPLRVGLGTSILEALTRQLGGHLVTSANSPGTLVALTIPRPPEVPPPSGRLTH